MQLRERQPEPEDFERAQSGPGGSAGNLDALRSAAEACQIEIDDLIGEALALDPEEFLRISRQCGGQ